MEMNGKTNTWALKNGSGMAILTILLLLLYFWRTILPSRETILLEANKRRRVNHIIVLAGQSNMAGRGGVVPKMIGNESIRVWDGTVPPESGRNPNVYRFNEKFQWEIAQEPIHAGIGCTITCGVGIGMAFANKLLALDPGFGTVGLVPCAAGGTSLKNWTSDTDYPYRSLLGRTRASLKTGGVLRAVLWYQGESDCKYYGFAKSYRQNIRRLISRLRTDLQLPMLPWFEVIIPTPKPPFEGPFIEDVRKAQQELDLPNVIKVDADGLPIGPDGIHLTTESYVRLGHMLAHAVLKNKSLLLSYNTNNNHTRLSNDTTLRVPT